MTFPSVRSEASGTETVNVASWTITYPATISAGDLLVLAIAADGQRDMEADAAGFTQIARYQNSTIVSGFVFAKVAAGSESGTFSCNLLAGTEQGAWRCAAYQDWYGTISGGFETSASPATGTSTTPDPPSLSPSWGSADTRYRAQYAADDGRTDATAYPSGYTINQNTDASGGSAGAGIGGASINSTATSEDPGPFTTDMNQEWAAWTMAIRPAVGTQTSLIIPRRNIPHLIGR